MSDFYSGYLSECDAYKQLKAQLNELTDQLKDITAVARILQEANVLLKAENEKLKAEKEKLEKHIDKAIDALQSPINTAAVVATIWCLVCRL